MVSLVQEGDYKKHGYREIWLTGTLGLTFYRISIILSPPLQFEELWSWNSRQLPVTHLASRSSGYNPFHKWWKSELSTIRRDWINELYNKKILEVYIFSLSVCQFFFQTINAEVLKEIHIHCWNRNYIKRDNNSLKNKNKNYYNNGMWNQPVARKPWGRGSRETKTLNWSPKTHKLAEIEVYLWFSLIFSMWCCLSQYRCSSIYNGIMFW